jgi:hypothetical protein
VYEIMEKISELQLLLSGKKTEEAKKLAQDSAWMKCQRLFRGTSCDSPGQYFAKDIIYQIGHVANWKFIERDTKRVGVVTVGKINHLNTEQLWMLTKLGVTDLDLEKLESEMGISG